MKFIPLSSDVVATWMSTLKKFTELNTFADFSYINLESTFRQLLSPLCRAVYDGDEELVRIMVYPRAMLTDDDDDCFDDTEAFYGDMQTKRVFFGSSEEDDEYANSPSDEDIPEDFHYFTYESVKCRWFIPEEVALICQRFEMLTHFLFPCESRFMMTKCDKYPINKGPNLDTVRLLLSYCRDKELRESVKVNLLYWAIRRQNASAVHELLKMGVNVNASPFNHETLLHFATRLGNHVIVLLLIEKNANVNVLENGTGETPLFLTVRNNNFLLSYLLISSGADVNIQNSDEQTPLHIAAGSVYDSTEIVKLLLKNGACFNVPDCFDRTPLALSLSNCAVQQDYSVTKCLVQHGNLPVHQSEMEALEFVLKNHPDGKLIKYMSLAGLHHIQHIQNLASGSILPKPLVLLWLNRVPSLNPATRFYQAIFRKYCKGVFSLYDECRAQIRTYLSSISNGRSIYDKVWALPLPEFICQDLLFEEITAVSQTQQQ